MKAHPEPGHKIVKTADLSEVSKQIILSHHEKLDGSGYPYGLEKKVRYPTGIQIATIADIFDALDFFRSYQNQRPSFDALDL